MASLRLFTSYIKRGEVAAGFDENCGNFPGFGVEQQMEGAIGVLGVDLDGVRVGILPGRGKAFVEIELVQHADFMFGDGVEAFERNENAAIVGGVGAVEDADNGPDGGMDVGGFAGFGEAVGGLESAADFQIRLGGDIGTDDGFEFMGEKIAATRGDFVALVGAVFDYFFRGEGFAVVVKSEEVWGGADDGIFALVGVADDERDGEADVLAILRGMQHLLIEREREVPGADVEVIDGVHHQLGAGAFFSDDDVVAVLFLAEECAGFAAQDDDGDGQGHAEGDGKEGEPGAQGTLTHLLED